MSLPELILNQPPHILWLLGGLLGLGLSLFIGEPSVAALGFAAILTAIAALSVSDLAIQMLLWGVLAIALALIMQGLVPTRTTELDSPQEADVSQAIPAGGEGEVAYEGSFWRARCQVSDLEIALGQRVHVVDRQGNTLIVLPATFPEANVVDRTV